MRELVTRKIPEEILDIKPEIVDELFKRGHAALAIQLKRLQLDAWIVVRDGAGVFDRPRQAAETPVDLPPVREVSRTLSIDEWHAKYQDQKRGRPKNT